MKHLGIALAIIALTACGGRASMPVNVTNSFDSKLSCTHLSGEFENNLKRLAELKGETGAKGLNNLGYIAMNPLAGVFFLDLSDTQKVEAQAIYDRSLMIVDLMSQKNCPNTPIVEDVKGTDN